VGVLVCHLSQQYVFVLLVDVLQVLLLVLFVVVEGFSVFLPDYGLLLVYLLLFGLFLFLLFDLTSQVVPHLFFLLLGDSLSPLVFFLFLSELVLNVPHHLLIFSADLLLLVLDDRVGKGGHNCLDLLLPFSLFVFSLFLELVLESGVFLLSFDVLSQ
jgi:hypothetical protein